MNKVVIEISMTQEKMTLMGSMRMRQISKTTTK